MYGLLQRAGQHCEQLHQQRVQPPRDLQQIQADELRVKVQGAISWVAMALEVRTRLWVGGVLSPSRDAHLLVRWMEGVWACALMRPVLIWVDGWRSYPRAVQRVFRERVPRRRRGRPRLRAGADLCLVQLVKYPSGSLWDNPLQPARGLFCRLVQGTGPQVGALLHQTPGAGVAHTAFIERLNATLRARLCGGVRRGRAVLRPQTTLQHGLHLIGTVYNFCTEHKSLRLLNPNAGVHWAGRTPAIAAGLTAPCWTIQELWSYHVPPARWTPPKRRGRPSKQMKALIARWCT